MEHHPKKYIQSKSSPELKKNLITKLFITGVLTSSLVACGGSSDGPDYGTDLGDQEITTPENPQLPPEPETPTDPDEPVEPVEPPSLTSTNFSELDPNTPIVLTFDDTVSSENMPIEVNTIDETCQGDVQLSNDGFQSCVTFEEPDFQGTDVVLTPTEELELGGNYSAKLDDEFAAEVGATEEQITQEVEVSNKTLVINEVGGSPATNGMRWFELYNPNSAAINLSNYQVITYGSDRSSGSHVKTQDLVTFDLPDAEINAGGYLIVSAQSVYADLENSVQRIYLKQGNIYPYWDNEGQLDLVQKSSQKTADFVSWGKNDYTPTTAESWSGSPVSGSNMNISIASGIARSLDATTGSPADTNSAADWQEGASTLAAPNDYCGDPTDADNDMIPDCNEQPGTTLAGMPLYEWGARAGTPDIFIEVDYIDATNGGTREADEGVIPHQAALQKVVDAFAKQNIAVHFDVGDLFAEAQGQGMNLGGGNQVPFQPWIKMQTGTAPLPEGQYDMRDYKRDHFDYSRLFLFHYLVYGFSQEAGEKSGSSGFAETDGNDVLVTFGSMGLTTKASSSRSAEENTNRLVNTQAVTVMHELGHNLGLSHGGMDDKVNYKTNYLSIMNYLYQIGGLPNPDENPGDRYYYRMEGKCNISSRSKLTDGYYTDNFRMDYSHGQASDINPKNVSEADGLGGGSPIDYDCDGVIGDKTGINIFALGSSTYEPEDATDTWTDHNDWADIKINFLDSTISAGSGDTRSLRNISDTSITSPFYIQSDISEIGEH